jgi:hypothetical protein
MDEAPACDGDPAEEYLARPSLECAGEGFRRRLLLQTSAVLRRRRRAKRWGGIAALVACYLAGIVTARFGLSPGAADGTQVMGHSAEAVRGGGEPSIAPASGDQAQSRDVPAVVLEWRALDSRERRPDLLRLAGDRYLDENNDVQSALRCYRRLLDTGSEADLAVSANDTWLLIALKEGRQKERTHANVDG